MAQRIAVVTGGMGGLGEAICVKLGEMGYRVDLCENCKTYLKTADSRERDGSLDGEVEDYLTLHLDFLAQEEGYRRPERLFVEMH